MQLLGLLALLYRPVGCRLYKVLTESRLPALSISFY